MEVFFDFEPVKRFCGVALTDITRASVGTIFSEPDEIEKGNENEMQEESYAYHFHEPQLTLFFNTEKLLCIAVSNEAFKMFGENVFDLREEELIYLFKQKGFPDYEIDKDWGEKQLVFENAGVTVFFDNQLVSEIFIDV